MQGEANAGKTSMPGGRILVPNRYVIVLSPADHDRLAPYAAALAKELAQSQAEYVGEQGWAVYGDILVEVSRGETLETGLFRVDAQVVHRRRPADPPRPRQRRPPRHRRRLRPRRAARQHRHRPRRAGRPAPRRHRRVPPARPPRLRRQPAHPDRPRLRQRFEGQRPEGHLRHRQPRRRDRHRHHPPLRPRRHPRRPRSRPALRGCFRRLRPPPVARTPGGPPSSPTQDEPRRCAPAAAELRALLRSARRARPGSAAAAADPEAAAVGGAHVGGHQAGADDREPQRAQRGQAEGVRRRARVRRVRGLGWGAVADEGDLDRGGSHPRRTTDTVGRSVPRRSKTRRS